MDQLDQLVAQAGVDFAAAADSAALETAKARYLGKGGSLTELLKGLGKLDPEARKMCVSCYYDTNSDYGTNWAMLVTE